jgi:hypothetical protein
VKIREHETLQIRNYRLLLNVARGMDLFPAKY